MPKTRSIRSAQTVGGVNMDALSMAGPAKNLTVVGMGKSELDGYLNAAAKIEGRTPEREPTPEKGFYYRSDHFSFAKLGVPMVYFEGGDDLVNGGKEAAEKAAKDYEENRYHAPGDEFDENWDWSGRDGRSQSLLSCRPDAGDDRCLAQLGRRRRVPRYPRQEPRGEVSLL